MTYATPGDVAVELNGSTSFTPAQELQWQSWLDRVERAIHRRFKRAGLDLDAQVALDDPTVDDVIDIQVTVVARKARIVKAESEMAPGRSRTRTVDDGSITDRNDGRMATDYDPLDLLDGEWARLLPDTTGGAFSTRPGFEPDRSPAETWL